MCLNNCSALVLPVVEVRYFIVSLERRYRCFFTLNAVVKVPVRLKELSHEIGMGYLWYGWKEPYLKMNL